MINTMEQKRPPLVMTSRPFSLDKLAKYFFVFLLLYVSYQSALAVEFSLTKLNDGLPYMADFLSRMFPPNTEILPRVLSETLLTIQLAWISSVIAAIL